MIKLEQSLVSLVLGTMIILSGSSVFAHSKEITTTEREDILRHDIDKGEKTGDLTLQEATKLRNEESNIVERQSKMKKDNGGKLSYEDIKKLEADLNKLSDRIRERRCEARTLAL